MFADEVASERVKKTLFDQYTLLQMTLAHEIQISYPALSRYDCKKLGYLVMIVLYGHGKMLATSGFNEAYKAVSRDALDRIIESYTASNISDA